MNIVSIVGARPQFIKVDVIDRAIKGIPHQIIHTGQHYDGEMSEDIINSLDISNKTIYNLEINSNLYNYGKQMAFMVDGITDRLMLYKPKCVIVYGDTNSTLAGAIAASRLNIPIVHVEAGLRSHNPTMIEEINRVTTDNLSSVLCCPTKTSFNNLVEEKMKPSFTGDVMLDSIMYYSQKEIKNPFYGKHIVATIHRASNINDRDNLMKIIRELNALGTHKRIIFPVHPHTKKVMEKYGIELEDRNITYIRPLTYLQTIALIRDSSFVITDSGGLQKEAFFLGKPCGVVREETEWTEIVDSGWSKLIDADGIQDMKDFNPPEEYDLKMFGDGKAGEKIFDLVKKFL